MKSDPTCIFCKIIAGEIPCHKVYEDADVLAFLDVGPLSEGHTLLIPKAHYETLDQVPADTAGVMGATLARLSRAIAATTGSAAYNILQNNGTAACQEVPHVHFHIIPRPTPGTPPGNQTARDDNNAPGNGLPKRDWPAGKIDHEQAAGLAKKIALLASSDD